MNPLKEAIQLLTKEEARAFKLFVQKVNTKEPRKDVELFDQIRKYLGEYDENDIFEKIYPSASKNTFHRLKSRLLQDINRSMVDLHLEDNDTLKLWHFMSVIELYLSRRHFELAHWFLRKAEAHAEKLHHHEALDIIYNNYILLSLEVVYINPEDYIQKRKENQKLLQEIRLLDDILAAAVYRTKLAQTWGEGNAELMAMLETTVNHFGNLKPEELNPSLQIKLFQSISNILIERRNYAALETYVRETYSQFEKRGIFNRHTHQTRLQMLTFHANALYKIGDFQASLKQAELLGRAMKDYESALQDKYIFFYYNILFVNYFKTDIDKAIKLLEEMSAQTKVIGTPFYEVFINMNLGLAWREKANYKKAIKYIVAATHHEGYRSAAPGLQLRIAIAEVMIRLSLKSYDVLAIRIKQIQHDFATQLQASGYRRDAHILVIIAMISETGDTKAKAVQDEIRRFLQMQAEESERDAELIGYDDYLREYLVP